MREMMMRPKGAVDVAYAECPACEWDPRFPPEQTTPDRCPKCGCTTTMATRWELPEDAALVTERPTPAPSTEEDLALVKALLRDDETLDQARARNKKSRKEANKCQNRRDETPAHAQADDEDEPD